MTRDQIRYENRGIVKGDCEPTLSIIIRSAQSVIQKPKPPAAKTSLYDSHNSPVWSP